MPSEWTKVETPTYQVITPLGRPLQEMPADVVVYTDGSGGKNTDDPRLRRCGWAWVIPGTTHPECGVCGILLGSQIVPRAELTAIIECIRELEVAPQITQVVIYSDCKMVVDLYNGGTARCKQSKLWELWSDCWAPYDRIIRGLEQFEIRKVKTHCDNVEIVPREHKHGSDMADKYAGDAVVKSPRLMKPE